MRPCVHIPNRQGLCWAGCWPSEVMKEEVEKATALLIAKRNHIYIYIYSRSWPSGTRRQASILISVYTMHALSLHWKIRWYVCLITNHSVSIKSDTFTLLCLSNQKMHHPKSIFHNMSKSSFVATSLFQANAIPLDITAKLENQSMPSGGTELITVMAC